MAKKSNHQNGRKQPLLSLCMIVKNEAATLERCLSTARPWVDELVIVDTGSTDGTQEIARRYADIFDEIEWPDSFSAARNHSFDLAHGKYLMWLDGDEYLPNPEDWKLIRNGLLNRNIAAAQIRMRNDMPGDQLLAADVIWLERIVRNDPTIRFEGLVHNQIMNSVERYVEAQGGELVRLDVDAIHTGYVLNAEEREHKYRRRIPLLKAEFEQPRSSRTRSYYGYQLGVAYYMLGEYEASSRVLNDIDYTQLNDVNRYHARLIATQAGMKVRDLALALRHCDALLTMSRTEPIGYFLTALTLIMAGQSENGMLMLAQAFKINGSNPKGIRFPLHEAALLQTIAGVAEHAGLMERAAFFYEEYLKRRPEDEGIRERLHRLKPAGVAA